MNKQMKNYIRNSWNSWAASLLISSLFSIVTLFADDNLPQANNVPQEEMIDSLTLVDESVQQVLNLLENLTGRILIVANNLPKVTINLNIPHPVSKTEAIASIKSVLNANGIAVTPMGDKYLRVVQVNRAKSSSPELIELSQLSNYPASQEVCSCIFPFNNLTAREAARLIHGFLTPVVSSVVTLDKTNALLITDALSNLQRLASVFSQIDKVGDIREKILFYDVKNVSAKELKQKFEELQKGALKRYLVGTTSFEADTRTNQLFVVTPEGNEKIIDEFMTRLDVNVGSLSRSHVFRIQHGSSKDLTELIKRLVQQQSQHEQKDSLGLIERTKNATLQGDQVAQFSKQLSIECDERLNAVVVYGTPTDIRQIQQLIEQLDVVLPQVRIEVIIAEVKLTDGQASGLDAFGYDYHMDGTAANNGVAASQATHIHSLTNITMPTVNEAIPFKIDRLSFPKFGIKTILNAAKMNSNVSILSTPTLLTTHAREASIKITDTRPYLSSIQTKSDNTSGDINNQTIEKVDAGIVLTVKPLIGINGVVQMEITQNVDNFSKSDVSLGGTQVKLPLITRREAKSFVAVQSGDILILGGLKRREFTDTKKRMFFFGELPLLGDALFSSKAKEEMVSELIIFIRPYVLPEIKSAVENTQEYIDKLSPTTKDNVNAYLETGTFKEEKKEESPRMKRRKQLLEQKAQAKAAKKAQANARATKNSIKDQQPSDLKSKRQVRSARKTKQQPVEQISSVTELNSIAEGPEQKMSVRRRRHVKNRTSGESRASRLYESIQAEGNDTPEIDK